MFKKIWNDPVWSKVIAASIIGAAGLAYSTRWWPVWITQRLAGLWRYSWAYSLSPSGAPHWLLILLILLAVPTIILGAIVMWTLGFPRKNVASDAPRRNSYTSDSFEGLRWRWQYADGEITDLGSFCPACDFQIYPKSLGDNSGRISFKCDHCNRDLGTHQGNYPYLENKITRLIQRKLRAKDEDLDLLTHVFNRKRFAWDLVSLSAQADQTQPLSLITMDIDRFKAVNDRYGQADADRILEQIAMVFRTLLDKRGECYRPDGDEFAVLLPNHSLAEAEILASRICTAVSARFKGKTGLTVSAGVASLPETTLESQQMIQDADAALYKAKHDGGNRAYACSKL